MMQYARAGVPMVVSAPSGGGKTTLCHRLLDSMTNVELSISYTTRAPRGQERDGVDYHFVDDDTFDRLVAGDALLEWAHVHGRRYGTSRQETEARLSSGVDLLFDIDVQGGRQIADRMPDAVLVFVLPPSMATLESRLRGRGSDADDEVGRRLEAARAEIEAARELYSYWVVNDELDVACAQLCAVLDSERLRRVDRNRLLADLLGGR
jgi:guanylate kinase